MVDARHEGPRTHSITMMSASSRVYLHGDTDPDRLGVTSVCLSCILVGSFFSGLDIQGCDKCLPVRPCPYLALSSHFSHRCMRQSSMS
jgi:hypothetical protein